MSSTQGQITPMLKSHRVVTSMILLYLGISIFCVAQGPSAKQEAVKSPCANDTVTAPNATSVTIKCSGLTIEQQKLLQNIPDLLNKLLNAQRNDNFQILAKLDSCIDDAAMARRSAAAAIRGVTTVYSFDGGVVTTVSHIGGGDQKNMIANGPAPEFYQLLQFEKDHKWQEMIDSAETTIKSKPDWLTPYLYEGEAYLNLGQTEKAVPFLKHVRDESGGSPEYANAAKWLAQLGY
jgi:hypothetical protein